MSKTVLVTGGSGKLAGEIINHLLKRATSSLKIVTTTRTPEKLSHFTERGVEVRKGDFTDPESLRAAFKGVDRVLITSIPSIVPGERSTGEINAIEAAEAVGVKHVVYSGVVNASKTETDLSIISEYAITQERLAASTKVTWTILQNGLWMESGLRTVFGAAKTGLLTVAWNKDTTAQYISRDDCAEVAAVVLASDGYENQHILNGGPQQLTAEEIVKDLNEVTGLKVRVDYVDDEGWKRAAAAGGLPPMYVDLLLGFEKLMRKGSFTGLKIQGPEILGRPLVTYRELIAQSKDALLAASASSS